MTLDTGVIGRVAAELMESVEDRFGEDAEIIDAIIIAEVRSGEAEDLTAWTHLRCSSDRDVVQRGLVEVACDILSHPDA